MSGLKRSLFGEKGTPSQVVDSTPGEFAALRQPFAQQLMGQMQNPAQFQGQFAAPMGFGEMMALQGVNQAAGGIGQGMTGQAMLGGAAGFNPFAQLSGPEQFAQAQTMQQAFGQNPLLAQAQGLLGQQMGGLASQNPQAQQFLQQQLGGQMNPFAQGVGLSGAEQQGLGQIQQQAFGANPLTTTVNQQLQQIAGSGGIHPQLDELIGAATRPIIEQFGDDQMAQRGAFTAAGQQVQGQGSSPFAQASARLQSGLANALGDTGAQLTAALNQQQQQAQLQALGMGQQQPGMQLQNMLAGQQALGLDRQVQQAGLDRQADAFGQMQAGQFAAAGMGDQLASSQLSRLLGATGAADQMAGNAFQRALGGLGAAGLGQERQGQAFEQQQQRQMQAGGALGQQQLATQMSQLEGQMQNLQAQGLPRMIQQLGLEGGLQEFQRQQQQMMQLMQLMGGMTAPNQAVLPGTPGSTGALGAFAGGLGQGLGASLFPG